MVSGAPGTGKSTIACRRARLAGGPLAGGPRWRQAVRSAYPSCTWSSTRPTRPGWPRFGAAALGWEVAAEEHDVANVWPHGYRYPDPVALPLVFPVPEARTGQNRVHLDLATESAAHQAAQVDRLLGLGAVRADIGQGDVPWEVMADPEGSEFCVLSPG